MGLQRIGNIDLNCRTFEQEKILQYSSNRSRKKDNIIQRALWTDFLIERNRKVQGTGSMKIESSNLTVILCDVLDI